MDSDIGELLREGIGRLPVAGAAATALIEPSVRAHRRRRVVVRTSATGAAAVVTGMAVVAAFLVGASGATRSPGRPGATLTAAYLVSHTLAAIDSSKLVERVSMHGVDISFKLLPVVVSGESHARTSYKILPSSAPSRNLAPRATFWSYRGQVRETGFSASGRVAFDASASAPSASGLYRVRGADYRDRTWWRGAVYQLPGALWPSSVPGGCPRHFSLPQPAAATFDWPAVIHQALSCGIFQVVGHRHIDGVDTIKIENNIKTRFLLPGDTIVGARIHQAVWLDPSSYLPVRIAWTSLVHHRVITSTVADFRWLSPTAAHVADLRSPIPAGFHRSRTGGLPWLEPVYGLAAFEKIH